MEAKRGDENWDKDVGEKIIERKFGELMVAYISARLTKHHPTI